MKLSKRTGTIKLLCRDSTSLVVHVSLTETITKSKSKFKTQLISTNDTELTTRKRRHVNLRTDKEKDTDEQLIYLIKIEELDGQYMKKRIVYMVS
jgi:hypothetical protein